MSFSNFNDALSSNNYCDPNDIGIEYETFKDAESINYQLPLDTSFNIQMPIDINTINSANYSENKNNKLTHRDCVNIYKNPLNCSDEKVSSALKHVLKCTTCRNAIKKDTKVENEVENKSLKSNKSNKTKKSNTKVINDLDDISFDESMDNKIRTIDKINQLTNTKGILKPQTTNEENESINKYRKYKYDEEIKAEVDKKFKENFLKYQNNVLKEQINKKQKENEEYLENNKKIDKLIKVMNYNIAQSTKINNLLANYLKNNNEKSAVKDTENQINSLTSYNVLIYCAIIIIILLVVDIALRVMFTNKNI